MRSRGRKRRARSQSVSQGDNRSVPDEKAPFLASLSQIPDYMKFNNAIQHGYRINFDNWKRASMTLFQIHNETLNVWTHLIGWAFMLYLMVYALSTWLSEATTSTKAMFLVWNIAAQMQMLASSYYHQFCCISKRYWTNLQRLDYCAIAVLICGSHFPVIHYSLYCNPTWKAIYLSGVVGIAFASVVISWLPYFQRPEFNTPRVLLFILTAVLFLAAFPHWIWYVPRVGELTPVAWRLALMGACYIGGACIYATRWPEVVWPGRCDTCNSHVIWHVFVVLAAWFMYCVCQKAHEWHVAGIGRCELLE